MPDEPRNMWCISHCVGCQPGDACTAAQAAQYDVCMHAALLADNASNTLPPNTTKHTTPPRIHSMTALRNVSNTCQQQEYWHAALWPQRDGTGLSACTVKLEQKGKSSRCNQGAGCTKTAIIEVHHATTFLICTPYCIAVQCAILCP